jgi:hypothetical protein
MIECVMKYLPLDAAADQMAITFIQKRLPPFLPKTTTKGDLNIHSVVKMVLPSAARLVIEDDAACIFSPLQNQREYHAIADRPEDSEEPGHVKEFKY